MSLSDCLKKIGKVHGKDLKAINDLVATGVSEAEAVRQVILSLDSQLVDIANQVGQKIGDETLSNLRMPETLEQSPEPEGAMPRGMIEILEGSHTIYLSKKSDMSTFLHESMHLFASMEGVFASKYGTTENQQAMLDHVGAKSFEEMTVKQHEQLAESFEVYLMEGKAPSAKLADAFHTFRSWLLNLYKSLKQLPNQKIDDDLRHIFDRLLATEQEIAEFTATPEYRAIFDTKESALQAGMTDAQWEEYKKAQEKRKNRATTTITERIIKQLRRRKTKEWREEKAPIIKQEKERLAKLPVYQILSDSRNEPMDYEAVKEISGGNKKLLGKMIKNLKKGGIPPEQYSEVYGYKSVKEMLDDIAQTESLSKAADAAAEAKMIAKYGDILNDGSIEAEVHEALHNTSHPEILLAEVKALNRKKADINRSLLKAGAKKTIAKMKHGEIKPDRFRRMAERAALQAERATTDEDRLAAKMQQIANHYLYKEALAVKADIGRWSKYINDVRSRKYDTKKVDAEHVQMMKLIANLYRKKRTGADAKQKTADDLRKVKEFYNGQEESYNVRLVVSDPQLVEAFELLQSGNFDQFDFTYFEDMTAEQLRSAYQNLKNMRFSAGKVAEDRATFKDISAKLTDIVRSSKRKRKKKVLGESQGQKGLDAVRGFFASLTSLRNKVRKLDAFDEYGEHFKEIHLAIEDAHNLELAYKHELFEKYKQELNDLDDVAINKSRTGQQTIITESGEEVTTHRESRFMMALYWGNQSSRDRLMKGYGLTERDVVKILSQMTEPELQLVNKIWKLNEEMWPIISEAAIAQQGVAPPKLESTPFVINGVEMTGGHQTIYYDSVENDALATPPKEENKYRTMVASQARATKERTDSGGRRIYLSKDNITRAIDENLHYAAYREASVKVSAIVTNNDYKNAVISRFGEPFYRSYIKTLQNLTLAKADPEGNKALAAGARWLRRNLTYAVLHYSIRNAVQQGSALPIALNEVGSKAWVEAAASFSSAQGRHDTIDMIKSKSKFMEQRSHLVNREANEFIRQIAIGGKIDKAWKAYTDHGFAMQVAIDSLLAYPTWLAKYNAEMMKHGDEKIAVSQADTAVSESIGSGSDLHLGEMFQSTNTQMVKLVTQFGSWFNNFYNRTYRETEGFGSIEHKTKIFTAMITMPLLVSVMNAALTMDLPEEDETVAGWTAELYTSHMGAMFPVVRQVVSAFQGWHSQGLLAKGTSVPAETTKLIVDLSEEDVSGLKATSKAIKLLSVFLPVSGSGQITRILDYTDSDIQGKEEGHAAEKTFQALVKGPTR